MHILSRPVDGDAAGVRRLSRERLAVAIGALALLLVGLATVGFAVGGDASDPARNQALPCTAVNSPAGTAPRSANGITHVANKCGIVGTDVEFQSRTDAAGKVHDYAFVGTMGKGFQIYDVTNPATPTDAGGYLDTGWQNDIQVRGNAAVLTFDGVAGEDSSASTCLKTRHPGANGQGVDIFALEYNRTTARFNTRLRTCVPNPPGGAHNSTLHTTGSWLAISNCCSDWAVDVIDLRGILQGRTRHAYRLIDESRATATGRCPTGASFQCIVVRKPDGGSASGLWRPHDVSFSRDGKTMYVAGLNSTLITDVSGILSGAFRTVSIIPNISEAGGVANTRNIQLSHQADVAPDGKVLVISDERGGGTGETSCNTNAGQRIIGGLHFWALAELPGVPASVGATPQTPKKLGYYANPNPGIGADPLQPVLGTLPRLERGCTVHVFRIGGNGSASPGPAAVGYDGVSRLNGRRLITGWYGAGVWFVDFATAPDVSATDRVKEDPTTTWGNTVAWNVMPGAETWSAKEYKGYIYTGDMTRGFDVFKIGR